MEDVEHHQRHRDGVGEPASRRTRAESVTCMRARSCWNLGRPWAVDGDDLVIEDDLARGLGRSQACSPPRTCTRNCSGRQVIARQRSVNLADDRTEGL